MSDEMVDRRKQAYMRRFEKKKTEFLSRFHPVHRSAFAAEASRVAAAYAAEEAENDRRKETSMSPALPIGSTTMRPRKKK